MNQFTSAQKRDNLLKLATYLSSLPADYQGFEMGDFFQSVAVYKKRKAGLYSGEDYEQLMAEAQRIANDYAANNGGVARCGAVACAIGHGPSAGFLFLPEELGKDPSSEPDWFDYTYRVFLDEEEPGELFDWMFGGDWSGVDNTPQGAGKRIRYYLAHGVPEEFYEKYLRDLVPLYQDS